MALSMLLGVERLEELCGPEPQTGANLVASLLHALGCPRGVSKDPRPLAVDGVFSRCLHDSSHHSPKMSLQDVCDDLVSNNIASHASVVVLCHSTSEEEGHSAEPKFALAAINSPAAKYFPAVVRSGEDADSCCTSSIVHNSSSSLRNSSSSSCTASSRSSSGEFSLSRAPPVFSVKGSNWSVEDALSFPGQRLFLYDTTTPQPGAPREAVWLRRGGLLAMLTVPFRTADGLCGVLTLGTAEPSFSKEVLAGLRNMCYRITPFVAQAATSMHGLMSRQKLRRFESINDMAAALLMEMLDLDRKVARSSTATCKAAPAAPMALDMGACEKQQQQHPVAPIVVPMVQQQPYMGCLAPVAAPAPSAAAAAKGIINSSLYYVPRAAAAAAAAAHCALAPQPTAPTAPAADQHASRNTCSSSMATDAMQAEVSEVQRLSTDSTRSTGTAARYLYAQQMRCYGPVVPGAIYGDAGRLRTLHSTRGSSSYVRGSLEVGLPWEMPLGYASCSSAHGAMGPASTCAAAGGGAGECYLADEVLRSCAAAGASSGGTASSSGNTPLSELQRVIAACQASTSPQPGLAGGPGHYPNAFGPAMGFAGWHAPRVPPGPAHNFAGQAVAAAAVASAAAAALVPAARPTAPSQQQQQQRTKLQCSSGGSDGQLQSPTRQPQPQPPPPPPLLQLQQRQRRDSGSSSSGAEADSLGPISFVRPPHREGDQRSSLPGAESSCPGPSGLGAYAPLLRTITSVEFPSAGNVSCAATAEGTAQAGLQRQDAHVTSRPASEAIPPAEPSGPGPSGGPKRTCPPGPFCQAGLPPPATHDSQSVLASVIAQAAGEQLELWLAGRSCRGNDSGGQGQQHSAAPGPLGMAPPAPGVDGHQQQHRQHLQQQEWLRYQLLLEQQALEQSMLRQQQQVLMAQQAARYHQQQQHYQQQLMPHAQAFASPATPAPGTHPSQEASQGSSNPGVRARAQALLQLLQDQQNSPTSTVSAPAVYGSDRPGSLDSSCFLVGGPHCTQQWCSPSELRLHASSPGDCPATTGGGEWLQQLTAQHRQRVLVASQNS